MFYYLLFFIVSLATSIAAAPILPTEFQEMIGFLQKVNPGNATPEEEARIHAYSTRIAIDGTPEQQAALEAVLEDEAEAEQNEIPAALDMYAVTLQQIDALLDSDIITPEVWQQKVMGPLKEIDAQGSPEEKQNLGSFITTHTNRITFHCKKLIASLYYDPTVNEALKFIIVNTVMGVLPSLGLKSLSILAGNLPIASATAQLTDLSVLCALDSIVRFGLRDRSDYISASAAAGLSSAVQDFIGFAGSRPAGLDSFGIQISTTELATLQAASIVFAKNNLLNQQNMSSIMNSLNWQDLVVGSQQIVTSKPEEATLIGYLQNALTPVLHNKTVRSITATTVSYAVEGALLAAALNIIGLGYYGEGTTQALIAGMTRGALEGLFMHAATKVSRPGILQRVTTGFGVSRVQKYLTSGIMGTSIYDVVPLVTQQVLAGAVDGVVQRSGGWKKFVTSLFSR